MKQQPNYENNTSLEQQLSQAQERIKVLLHHGHLADMMNDASIDRIMALDTELNITAWNKRSEMITGIPRDTVMGENFYDVFPEWSRHQATINAISQALKGRTVFLPADKSAPDEGYYENHFIPLKDEHEKVIGVMNIKHDVAHRIKAENELRSLNKALAKKNKELKQRNEELLSFTHITSHDLKEPLRKIYTFIEMIATQESKGLSDKAKNYFKRVQASVQRMGILTDDILTFAQIETDSMEQTDVPLDHLLLFVKQTLQEEIIVTKTIIVSEALPVVRGYRKLLSQMLYHLLANAIKFRRKDIQPEIRITTKIVAGADLKHPEAIPDVHYTRLCIEDNGIGFDKAYKDKIFQMFQRLHKDEYPGTGIGLALCKKIAALHQGFITASSMEGKGSTFDIFLPFAPY